MIDRRLLPPELAGQPIAACLGLISDTHLPERCAALPSVLFELFAGVDLILHGGDVGELRVLDELSAIAPVVAVHGNDDTPESQRELPYQQVIAVAGKRILLTHAHYPDRAEELASRVGTWTPVLRRRAEMGRRAGADIVVFGHTHIPMAMLYVGVLLVNPGSLASANPITKQTIRTVALLLIPEHTPPLVTHVDLARLNEPFVPAIDVSAPFRTAMDRFSASILSPELAVRWNEWSEVARLAPEPHRAALVRVAHRCWSGEQETIGGEDLLAELRSDSGISEALLAQFEGALARPRSEPSTR